MKTNKDVDEDENEKEKKMKIYKIIFVLDGVLY